MNINHEMLVNRHRRSEEVEWRDVLSGGHVGLRMGAATVTLIYSHEQTTTHEPPRTMNKIPYY